MIVEFRHKEINVTNPVPDKFSKLDSGDSRPATGRVIPNKPLGNSKFCRDLAGIQ
jgi:hypothetical protein